jgi:hypothetical protein
MLNKIRERLTTTRRHRIAMRAARNAVIYSSTSVTPDDVINLAYGAHGIHLTDTEARDALAAELAYSGRRLNDTTT